MLAKRIIPCLDIKDLEVLKEAGCEGAILGKAIYENKIELKSLMNFIETKC